MKTFSLMGRDMCEAVLYENQKLKKNYMFQNFKCYDMNFDLKFVINLLCELISFQKKKLRQIKSNMWMEICVNSTNLLCICGQK